MVPALSSTSMPPKPQGRTSSQASNANFRPLPLQFARSGKISPKTKDQLVPVSPLSKDRWDSGRDTRHIVVLEREDQEGENDQDAQYLTIPSTSSFFSPTPSLSRSPLSSAISFTFSCEALFPDGDASPQTPAEQFHYEIQQSYPADHKSQTQLPSLWFDDDATCGRDRYVKPLPDVPVDFDFDDIEGHL